MLTPDLATVVRAWAMEAQAGTPPIDWARLGAILDEHQTSTLIATSRDALAKWFHETNAFCAHRGDVHECVLRARDLLASGKVVDAATLADDEFEDLDPVIGDVLNDEWIGHTVDEVAEHVRRALAAALAERGEAR